MEDWFVRNLRDMKWWGRDRRGFVSQLVDDDAAVGVNLFVLTPGTPMAMYHWEADQEGFLVLSGEAVLIIDDEEHPLRQWDYVHCPPNIPHTRIGAGSGPCAILAIGGRAHQDGPDWGGYPLSDVATKHDAASPVETNDPKIAYARFPARAEAEFQEDWLP
jgi:uncharacterized cupin superfamily protein